MGNEGGCVISSQSPLLACRECNAVFGTEHELKEVMVLLENKYVDDHYLLTTIFEPITNYSDYFKSQAVLLIREKKYLAQLRLSESENLQGAIVHRLNSLVDPE